MLENHIFTKKEIEEALYCSKKGKTAISTELEYIAMGRGDIAPIQEEGGLYV